MPRMYLRPAGMSDDDDDEDDDYGFSYEHNYSSNVNSMKKKVIDYDNIDKKYDFAEQHALESNIMNACVMGHLDMIQEYLKEHDVNKFLHTGWTLLLYATSSVQLEVTEHLLVHGADPNKHKDGFTPLMALCSSTKDTAEKSVKCLVLLIEAGADINMTNKQRETALMYACKSQDAEFITELIEHVKNINTCDNEGKTALSYAVASNKPDIVKILLKHNADTSLTDRYNSTAKDIADTKGFLEISALLATDEEEILPICQISEMKTWKDLFPDLYPRGKELLDNNISAILYGMGLERYNILFQGMDLKTFLQLTEDDLHHLGIDITVHKKQFLENLHKFHCKKWHVDSIGIISKSLPYTIYDGVTSLGNIKKQIGVISSSFQYIKNNLIKAASEEIHFDSVERMKYEEELRNTQKTLKILKNEIMHIRKLAWKINKENNIDVPATFVTHSEKSKSNWIITLSVTLMVGLYLCKTRKIQGLWNMYMIKM